MNSTRPITPSTLSDAEAAPRALVGERAAFEAIMRRHNRMLFRTARSILKSDTDAEDVLQEAYMQAYRALGSFRGEAQLSTWLTRIVVNQALARLRRRRRDGEVFELENVIDIEQSLGAGAVTDPQGEGPEGEAMRSELRALLEQKIDALPAAFRTVFVLRAVEELSVEETARCLRIPEATVRTRFFRARSLVRESIEQDVDSALRDAFGFDGERCDRIVAAVLTRIALALPTIPSG